MDGHHMSAYGLAPAGGPKARDGHHGSTSNRLTYRIVGPALTKPNLTYGPPNQLRIVGPALIF